MTMLPCSVAAMAVTSIYYLWRAYAFAMFKRERTLRERVAYMLWAMAERTD